MKIQRVAQWTLFSTLGSLAILLLVAWGVFGSPSQALRYATGRHVIARESVYVVAKKNAGDKFIAKFDLKNLGFHPARVIGVETSCGCTVLRETLPFDIAARETSRLEVVVTIPSRSIGSSLTSSLLVYVDQNKVPLPLKIHVSKVLEAPTP